MRLLAVHAGNTSTAFGLYEDAAPIACWKIKTAELLPTTSVRLDAAERPARMLAASVVPAAEPVLIALAAQLGLPLSFAGRDFPPLVQHVYPGGENRPGIDRLLSASAAFALSGAAVVADFGTAVTVDGVSASGQFIPGGILPGPALCEKALCEGTALLRERGLGPRDVAIPGTSTRTCMANGIFLSLSAGIEILTGVIEHVSGAPGARLATGGAYETLEPHLKVAFDFRRDLVLQGLVRSYLGAAAQNAAAPKYDSGKN